MKLTVANDGGSATSSQEFKYEAPPTITSFAPAKAAIGAPITLVGNEFSGVTKLEFGAVELPCPGPDCTVTDNEHILTGAA